MSKKMGSPLALGVLLIGLFSANVSQAGMTNTFTWIGGTSTNAASSANYTATVGNISGWSLSGSTNAYVYPGTNTQTGTQTLDYGGAATVYTYGLTVTNWTSNVIMTNMGDWRVDNGGLVASNAAASTLSIMTTGGVGQLGGDATFSGNMSVYVTGLGGHSTAGRTLTNNLTNLTISNFTVNSATIQATSAATKFTLSGTGNTTIFGAISNKTLFAGSGGNLGSLFVNSGTLNIATTNSANTNWVSGLVLSNSGSVYVLGQLSLGSPTSGVQVGAGNATNRTTFGLMNTSSITSVALTNNFVIANTAAATNIFKAQSGKTLTLSGAISGSVNGTVVADAGTLVLSGANTALSLPFVVTNSGTLVASNNSALGSSNVTVASGATLKFNAVITNAVVNNGGVTIADGGTLVSGNGYSGTGSLSVGATAPSTASFTSSLLVGTNSVGPLSLTGNGTLGMNVATQVKSSGAVAITSTSNRITVTGTAKLGTNDLVVGTSLTGASASSIALNGSGVGSPSTPIALGSSYTAADGTKYIFTNSATALQLVVEGQAAQDLAFANASGLWNTDSANTPWKTVPGGVSASFRTGDSTAFTNAATVGVDIGGVSPNVLSFANPVSTAVVITNGPITATTVTASGAGSVNVSSDLTATAGITISSGNITLAKTTVNSGGLSVAGGSLTNSGVTTITAGGLNVSAGSLAVSGSISAGAVSVTGGTVSGSGSITGSSYNVANATYGVNLTGANTLTVSGTSTLNGANSGFSGPVSVTGGNLSLGSSSALGTGALNLSGGSVLTLSSGTLGNSIALGAGGGGVSNSGNVTINGAVTNATGQVNQNLSKNGAGVLTLSGAVGSATNITIGLSITEGNLKLSGSQYYLTNFTVAQGAQLLINGGVLNTKNVTSSGSGIIEVTNTVTYSNWGGDTKFANPFVIDAASKLVSGPMTASSYYMLYSNGVSGDGMLEINGPGTNRIGGAIGVLSVTVNSGGNLRLSDGYFTNPSTVMTNNGAFSINSSSGILTYIGTNVVNGVTNYTTTNNFSEITGSGSINLSGSKDYVLNGKITGLNQITMSANSAIQVSLNQSNSFTGGIRFDTNNANGAFWLNDVNAIGSGAISNNISPNASIGLLMSGSNAVWTNTVYTGTTNTAYMAFAPNSNNSITLNGKVSGSGWLKVSKAGDLYVQNMANDYTGGTEVGTGSIVISNSAALGTGPVNFGTGTNSILKVTDSTSLTNTMTISGVSGTSSSTTQYSAYIQVSSGKTFTNSGGLNNKLSVGTTANDQKYGGNLVKQGAGTAVLSGVNGYSGSTTINDGTLTLSGATLNTPLVSLTGSSAAVLKLMSTGVLSSSVSFTGDNSSANTGTVDFNAAGSYTFNRYGESAANPGLNMNFTNSSSGAVTATFTNGTNYINDPTSSGGGKTIWNRSTNLTLVFSGAMEIGSSADNNFGLSGDGNFTLNGSVTNSGTGIRALAKSGAGTATLNAQNSYNGATTVGGGTLVVGASGSLPVDSPIAVSGGATLRFNKSSSGIDVGAMTVAGNLEQNLITITSSGAVDLTGSSLKVNGSPTLGSYTLVSGTSVAGTPTLNPTISGYKLSNSATSLLLVKKATPAVVVTPGTYTYSGAIQGPGAAEVSTGGSTSTPSLSYSGTTLSGSTYGPSSTPPTAPGSYTVTATTDEDPNYIAGTSSATAFTIGKATPSITAAPAASDITYGQTLADSNLTGGTASTTGSFAFTTPSTSPNVGTANQGVTFTPNDTANYNTATTSVSVTVASSGPTGLSYTSSSINGTVGAEIVSLTPAVTGSGITYSIDPSLPSGLLLNPTTGVISGTPSVASASAVYTVTATNAGGSTTATLTVAVAKIAQTITGLATTDSKTYGGIYMDFDLAVTKGASSSALSFSSSEPSVATIDAATGSVHIVGAGTTTLTVNQAGDANYNAAPAVTQTLTVGKAAITLAADAKSKTYGEADPALTYQVTNGALVGSDVLAGSLSRAAGENVGTYAISSTLANANYDVTFVPASLTISASAPTGLSYSSSSINGTVGTAIADLTPAVTGSDITYSIDPALPSGLLLSPTTGVISGTPAAPSASAIYTVTAANVGGSTTTALTIVVGHAVGPVVVDDELTKSGDNGSIMIPVSQLLANDYRITNSSGATAPGGLTVTAVTSGSGNTATLAGVFIQFTPSSASTDTFTYTVSDGTKTATGTVTVTTETEAPVFNLQIVQVGTAVLLGGSTTVTHDFIGVPNQTYLVEYATDLAGAWTSVGNQSTGVTGSFSLSITKSGDFVSEWNEHMFFRARLVR
jgi:autotransporter-associated beta strand protein